MSNLSQFFGAESSAGDIWSNPEAMPASKIDNTVMGVFASSTFYASTTAGFYSSVGGRGSHANHASSSANTYYTVADITGAGYCNSWWGWLAASNSTATWTTRVTMDGKVYTLVTDPMTVAHAHRPFYGTLFHGLSGTNGNDVIYSPSSITSGRYAVNHWHQYVAGEKLDYTTANMAVQSPLMALQLGKPMLRFRTGLKIEMKMTQAGATATSYNSYCGATYHLTGDLS